ncbi:MAG: hypothetical protein KDE56_24710, partial [Anaerolineales bacterium]|nr:hypothetical protein [Anaerolineales bacterium]
MRQPLGGRVLVMGFVVSGVKLVERNGGLPECPTGGAVKMRRFVPGRDSRYTRSVVSAQDEMQKNGAPAGDLLMNSMLGVLARIPLFQAYRRFGAPKMLPLNLTLSPSPKCNSRCLTCNIW